MRREFDYAMRIQTPSGIHYPSMWDHEIRVFRELSDEKLKGELKELLLQPHVLTEPSPTR
jgi:hypothetical protein